MFRLIEWLWGLPLGKIVKFKSWAPSWDQPCRDWRHWGVAWPVMLVDGDWGRQTTSPIWNWMWLRNRLGFPPKESGDPMPM